MDEHTAASPWSQPECARPATPDGSRLWSLGLPSSAPAGSASADRLTGQRLGHDRTGGSDRDGEGDPLGPAARSGVDPDYPPRRVEEGTPAVAGVDRGVGLDQPIEAPAAPDVDRAVEAGDDAGRDRVRVLAERATDRDDGLPQDEPMRVADRRCRQAGRLDLDDREVRRTRDPVELARELAPVGERDGDRHDLAI